MKNSAIRWFFSSLLYLCCFMVWGQQPVTSSEQQQVVLKNERNLIPLLHLNELKVVHISVSQNSDDHLYALGNMLDNYTEVHHFYLNTPKQAEEIIKELTKYNLLILGGHFLGNKDKDLWGEILKSLQLNKFKGRIIATFFGSELPVDFDATEARWDAIIWSESVSKEKQEDIAQVVFGGKALQAKLEKELSGFYPKGTGGVLSEKIRLGYAKPEDEGLDASFIYHKVDSIMTTGIKDEAFPGAQLLVAKNGNIIYHEAFGYHTYDSLRQVSKNDLYDLASVTKITGPLPVLMKLYDQGIIDLDAPFYNYWKPWKRRQDKKDLTLREILAHQAGLAPYIVFLQTIRHKGHLKKRFVRSTYSSRFSTEAYEGIYIKNRFRNKIYRMINRSEVSSVKKYNYSGTSFLLYPEIIKSLTGIPYDDYLKDSIYSHLGANHLMFHPKGKYPDSLVVPTEIDTLYRKDLVKGWVHDENASFLGGISGNAGLFGTATDMAKVMQMYLQMGSYGGEQFISEKTMQEFIKVQYPENENKRGLGFDKPLLNNASLPLHEASPAPEVSTQSFGHGGFTGTYVWADPENQMIFIFLSNRVYPTRENRSLYSLNIRPALMQVFYQAEQRKD